MRHFLARWASSSMLCLASAAAMAAAPTVKSDRIVIFYDYSAAFTAFLDRVLRDPEVATFMSRNFEIYSVEAGSPEAEAMPLFGGARSEPRIVVSATRLDNSALFFQPTVSKADFFKVLQAVKKAVTPEDIANAAGGFSGPTADNLTRWAREFYPSLVEPGSSPAGLRLGFLISKDLQVKQHSAGLSEVEGSMLDQLRRMMPNASVPERPVSSGASCFGGFDSKGDKYGRYCVTWAVVSE